MDSVMGNMLAIAALANLIDSCSFFFLFLIANVPQHIIEKKSSPNLKVIHLMNVKKKKSREKKTKSHIILITIF